MDAYMGKHNTLDAVSLHFSNYLQEKIRFSYTSAYSN